MGAPNAHTQRVADAANCPTLTGNATQRARRADGDAAEFAMLVREEPPAVVWGRVARLAANNPQRLHAALIHLAAMVDVDAPPATWTRQQGGTASLHPDYTGPKPEPKTRPARTPEVDAEIVRLARDSALSDFEISTRLGQPLYYVTTVRRTAGVLYKVSGQGPTMRDREVARLDKLGYPTDAIARQLGVTERTVMRARQRNTARAAAEQRAAPGQDGAAA